MTQTPGGQIDSNGLDAGQTEVLGLLEFGPLSFGSGGVVLDGLGAGSE